MKKIYLLLALIVAVNTQFAEAVPYRLRTENIQKDITTIPMKSMQNFPQVIAEGKNNNGIQALTYSNVDSLSRGTFMMWSNITPLAYDDASKSYYYNAVKYVFNAAGNLSGGSSVFSNSPNAKSWTRSKIQINIADEIIAFASIGVANPNNSTNPNDINFVSYIPTYKPNGTNYSLDGGYLHISNGTDQSQSDMIRPSVNNSGVDGKWGVGTSMVGFSNGNDSYVAATNQLFPSENQQYGLFGTFTMDIPNFNLTNSLVPRQWWLDKYFASPSIGSTFNGFTHLSNDADGNLYAAAYNRFVNDPDNRVPSVSKSTDQGKTWSEFNTMPSKFLSDYVTITLGLPAEASFSSGGFSPYTVEGFTAISDNNYSFFFKLAMSSMGGNNPLDNYHLVEANFSNGVWKMNKVADLSWTDTPDQITNNVNTGNYQPLLASSQLGYEIQAARTADGKNIVVKWINTIINPLTLSTPVTIYITQTNQATGQPETIQQQFTELNTNDIFFAYKDIETNTWSKVINATGDKMYDKGTFIPKLLPSIKNVGFIKLETRASSYNDGLNLITADPLYTQRVIDRQQFVRTTSIDLTDEALSVETVEPINFEVKLFDVYPNPSNQGSVQITYSSNEVLSGNIELFDSMGQKVATIYSGIIEGNLQGLNFNTNNLSTGTYFVTLNAGNKSFTKKFNVIK